jgi:excisionase family DNA binding protein
MANEHETHEANETIEVEPKLVPLPEALRPYRGVSVRTGRELIKAGKLAASKPGREYLVDPADVARVLAPTTKAPKPRNCREGENARAMRQLAEAGVR